MTPELQMLKAVAGLKVEAILWWRNDRLADARINASSPLFARSVEHLLSHPGDQALRREVRDRLAPLALHNGYANLMIAATDGKLEFSLAPGQTELEGGTSALGLRAVSNQDAVTGDLFACPASDGIRMDTAAPILADGGGAIGILFLRDDPVKSLYPLVESWPNEARTAETVLVRRDGEAALIINDLRFKQRTALALRFPLGDVRQLVVQAVLGTRGFTEGLTYRGKAAIADIVAVPDSNWIMIAMEDRDEVMAAVYSHGRLIGLLVALLVSLAGTGVALLVQKQRKNHYKELFRTEAKRAETLDVFRTTLYSIGDGVITADAEGKVRHLNRAAEALTGWKEEEARGRSVSEVFQIVNAMTRSEVEDLVGCVLRKGIVVEMANHTLLIARDGRERVIADSGSPIRNSAGRTVGVVLVFRDVTLKEKVEKELFKIEKLESLSVLAGGIAHDFNNILTAVLGNISLTEAELPWNTPVREWIKEATRACFRAKHLTQQLLTFAKGGTPIKRLCTGGDLIMEAASFACHGSAVSCRYEIARDLWPIEVDDGQLGQVIQNMVINSVQAMPMGGTITVAAANVTLAKDNRFLLAPGPYLRITVSDEGAGIPQDLLPKIFDPYFTTKQCGSGLGLATCYSIVKNHQGHIDVYSTPGAGTTFETYLPSRRPTFAAYR